MSEYPIADEKNFLDHIEDLRWMIIKVAAALGVGVVASFIFTRQILDFLTWPLRRIGQDPDQYLKVLGVVDPFAIQLNIAFMGGFIVALPFVLFFVGQFLLPALTMKERRLLIPVFTFGALLFLGGLAFCYALLLPTALQFFQDYNTQLGLRTEWTIQNYLEFVVQMLLAFGLCFELPLVILVLNYLGILSHFSLRYYRKHAVVVILIMSACITPTSDPFSLAMLAVPMALLYESCVWITWWRERKLRQT
jgi:sec-independent protein translocase protein TatC